MNKKLIVLSLFDGMSCGQIALKELDHNVKYYASEIDKFAIQQTQHNFPGIIQLGDITKWKEWDIDWSKIDLILAGSPCQGFSFAGKQLNFSDPRSALFFVFVDILNHVKKMNPDVKFLLENVNMKKEYLRIISEHMGLFPVRINSNLISAQNRDRWYWTNIRTKETGLFRELWTDIPQPSDRSILLKDILQPEEEIDDKYYLKNDKILRGFKQAAAKYWKSGNRMGNMDFPNNINKKAKTLTVVQTDGGRETNHIGLLNDKGNLRETKQSTCIDANYHKGMDNHAQRTMIGCIKFGRSEEGKALRKNNLAKGFDYTPFQAKEIVDIDYEKMNTVTCATTKDNLIASYDNPQYDDDIGNLTSQYKLRRLTPTECSRLQTIPEWYKWKCSDTQAYRMLGNSWTIEVIKHILSFL